MPFVYGLTHSLRPTLATALLVFALGPIPGALRAQAGLLDSARARLARLDGEVRVAGLDSTVEVRRDQWGVPHIYAKTTHDLFFAQGYVVAQDRLWQMEIWRRTGEGRLAEVLGPSFVERDRTARLLRFRGDMEAEWSSYAPDAREIIRAFVAGVNARIAEVKDRPPIEFSILGFAPEPWDETVPLQRTGALAMTGNALEEVSRATLLKALGKARLEALMPPDPWPPLDPAPGLDLTGIGAGSLGAAAIDATIPFQRLEGSNNWVVSGAKTATGKPLLANDPHRAVALPSLRYLTHLVGPGWNVIGAGEPGVPGVAGPTRSWAGIRPPRGTPCSTAPSPPPWMAWPGITAPTPHRGAGAPCTRHPSSIRSRRRSTWPRWRGEGTATL